MTGTATTTHDFRTSLVRSEVDARASFWTVIYRELFPGFRRMTITPTGSAEQRSGVDRFVVLNDGSRVRVEEKLRHAAYDDVLLERWECRDRRLPGWIQRPLSCDYLVYAFEPTGRAFLFPYPLLRRAWQKHGREWIRLAESGQAGFRIVTATSTGGGNRYVSESVCVPIPQLMAALADAMRVTWREKA